MSYGKFVSGGMLVRQTPAEGYKPIVETAPETPEGYHAISRYVEDGDVIRPVWEYIELTDEEKREIEERGVDDTEDKAEAFDILLGGAT